MNHFLDIHKTSPEDLRAMIEMAKAMKRARGGRPKGMRDDETPLTGRMIALIFEKPSTRTRVSFDVGARQMGGETMVLSGKEMQLGHGESIADTARVLSRFVDLIMLRTFEEATLLEMAEHATVPVINGLTDSSHPCQIMADIMTYEEHRGSIAGRRFVWAGDGNNVCASWLHAAGQFGFDLTFTGPEAFDPDPRAVEFARSRGSRIEIERDPLKAAEGADAIVTDTWVSMHDPESARERRNKLLRPYQVNAAVMARAKPDALFMHCLPAHRNEEATDEVMDGPHSVIFDESENRLHAQKAILRWCLGV
ncbi:ornithine carbamoyltransferase [Albidovulum inexpectatum]|uniref:Ornithine carbamoyltransferase n=1 Tax=Albidovulum inexpectatum TaxID=196587 RepID=A0A2S5JGN3_9RHOB|nr:ornithine carbamoyltransferase [Albidovulum inexpectatum]PPB80642.1 ornithine carbamoyltransferase [Albidovulum inexpectatum]